MRGNEVSRKSSDANRMNTQECGQKLSASPDRGHCHHPKPMGGQMLTYPQAQEEFLLAARHHTTIVQHRTDLLQGFGSEHCGLVAEDVDVGVLWHRSEKTLLCWGRLTEVRDQNHLPSEAGPLHPPLHLTSH